MNIRSKIVLVVLPLIVTPLLFAGLISSLLSRNGITSVASQFLRFKAEELRSYADSQWSLLVENGLQDQPTFRDAAVSAVQSFAANIVRSETELIFALDANGEIVLQAAPVSLLNDETVAIQQLQSDSETGWQTFPIAGVDRVAHVLILDSLGWSIFVSEERNSFYSATNQIIYQLAIVLGVAIVIAIVLLMLFANYLTLPLRNVVSTMTDVIETSDMSKRVEVLYADETGKLGHTFNIMISELQNAYDHIKGYALRAAVAQSHEQKIRNIFQKYVPKDIIEQFFANPESMLIGENRVLAVLFSDIRAFTTISESLRPDEMVESLNQYFTLMVDAVMNRRGVVDKYIGDAIMAFFGAPVRRENDAEQSVRAALDMLDALVDFNVWQRQRERPEFRIGIGINYGAVTVGNIGSEKKMDYTVIGDMVNLASRLEGLTKQYKQPLLVSESVQRKMGDSLPYRLVDKVVVKGRTSGVEVFTVKGELTPVEEEAWQLHATAMAAYFTRAFDDAANAFQRVIQLIPGDRPAEIMLARCQRLMTMPPDEEWTGVVEMTEK